MAGVQRVLRFYALFVSFGRITGQYFNAQEIKYRPAVAEEALSKKSSFRQQIGCNLGKEPVEHYNWGVSLYGGETWTLREADHQYLGSF
jgi:hypothetical protein